MIGKYALDKALTVRENTLDGRKSWKKFDEVVNNVYFKQLYAEFTKEFILKCVTEYISSCFITVLFKKSIQEIGLEYGLFSHIIIITLDKK